MSDLLAKLEASVKARRGGGSSGDGQAAKKAPAEEVCRQEGTCEEGGQEAPLRRHPPRKLRRRNSAHRGATAVSAAEVVDRCRPRSRRPRTLTRQGPCSPWMVMSDAGTPLVRWLQALLPADSNCDRSGSVSGLQVLQIGCCPPPRRGPRGRGSSPPPQRERRVRGPAWSTSKRMRLWLAVATANFSYPVSERYGFRRLYLTLTLISLLTCASPGVFRISVTEITLLSDCCLRHTFWRSTSA